MRYLLLILILSGCAGAPIDDSPEEYWEYEAEYCDVLHGITFIDERPNSYVEVLCLLPNEVIDDKEVCYGLCKPFSETCPQVECE